MNPTLNSGPSSSDALGRIAQNARSLPSADQRMAQALTRIAASRSALIVCLSPNPPESRDTANGHGGGQGTEPSFAEMFTSRIHRKGLLQGSWLTARTLARRWWNRQPWHSSVELVGQTLAHQARPLMRRNPLATLGVGAALGVMLVMAIKMGRPRVMQHIQQQASPWRERLSSLLWTQLTAAPVQMALAGALAAWLADHGNRTTHASPHRPAAEPARTPETPGTV
jgi:hypothetical protein